MRILLVEDQPDIASMYSLGLQAAGHEVMVAVDGREFRSRAQQLGALNYLVKTEVRPTRLAEIVDAWIAEGITWPANYGWDDLNSASAEAIAPPE
jgi:DNA-binding NtrC family response regulator